MCSAREFNLVDEPWIRVRFLSGEIKEMSLLDVFRNASIIAALVNDLPTQDFAILRVLLAILRRSVMQGLGGDEDPVEVWDELWNADDLPIPQIESYVATWRNRFDLFDETVPFMQVGDAYRQKRDICHQQ
ncbi:MAG TPA: type I-E CRISPR-associated protein Cse1/CasA, partial [Atopobiaceae bacterium]|nr:type I-E CRISPR-associated protein Cse1/CasA [Atopobiaceae bacterium]